MLSWTVKCGNRPICWKTYPMPRRSCEVSSALTLLPSIVMSPSVIGISRLTIFSAVVLPHPEGPISTHISPLGTSKLRSSTATCVRPG